MQNVVFDALVGITLILVITGCAIIGSLRAESRREAAAKDQFRNSIKGHMDDLVASLSWLKFLAEGRGLIVSISSSDDYGEGWYSFTRKVVFMGAPRAENGSTCAAEIVLAWRSEKSDGRHIIVTTAQGHEQQARFALVDIAKAADAVEAHIRELYPAK